MTPPNGLDEILSVYGNLYAYLDSEKNLDAPKWERDTLATCRLPDFLTIGWDTARRVAHFQCNKALVKTFEDVFYELHRAGLWPELKTFDGCFNYRKQRTNAYRLSTHSWGVAVDLNASTNALGMTPTIHAGIVRVFKTAGFTWGGDFPKQDGMHFQFCTGY